MKIKAALITILICILFPVYNVFGQSSFNVNITGVIDIDYYSTITLDPTTVEIFQPSLVKIRALSSNGMGIAGKRVVILSSELNIIQPTTVTDSLGYTSGSVSTSSSGTYTVCAKDITYGYDITIQNCKTLYVIPVAIPVIVPEPYYTKGDTNLILWSNLGTGYKYYIEASLDSSFSSVVYNSGWISTNSFEFTNLENERMYFYRVKAQNPYGGISSWSPYVFTVQDGISPTITDLTIGDVGSNTTTVWDPDYNVKMIFRVRDNLMLMNTTFFCVDSLGKTYPCTSNYKMEGDNLIVNMKLVNLEKSSSGDLQKRYEFCIEAIDGAGNVSRSCEKYITVPVGIERTPPVKVVDTITRSVDQVYEVIDNTFGKLSPVALERVTATTTFLTIYTAVAMSITSFYSILFFITNFVLNILSWLGFRVGSKPLGYVYNAITKEPVSQAIVRIYDKRGKIVWSDVTNSKGYFSARLEDGEYKLIVRAVDYIFPSTIVYGKEDFPLKNIYHGNVFFINNFTELHFSVPVDPVEVSKFRVWREILWGRVRNVVTVLHFLLFIVGLILALYLFLKDPYWFTAFIVMLYVPSFFLTLRNIFGKREKYGYVKDMDGKGVEGIVVVLKEVEYDRIVMKRVTDMHGRYRMLVDSGKYNLQVMDTSLKVEKIDGGNEISIQKGSQWVRRDITVSVLKK